MNIKTYIHKHKFKPLYNIIHKVQVNFCNTIFVKIIHKSQCCQSIHNLVHNTKISDQYRVVHHDKAILTPLIEINEGGG